MYIMHIMMYRFRGMHDCLVPVTPYLASIFQHLRNKGKLPPRVRAADMRHILLLLPFLLEGLLTDEVEEHNRANPLSKVSDPSPMMVQIVLLFLSWYHLYRRRIPAKDEDDIVQLTTLAKRYIMHIMHIMHIIHNTHNTHKLHNTHNTHNSMCIFHGCPSFLFQVPDQVQGTVPIQKQEG